MMKYATDVPLPPTRDEWGFIQDLQEPAEFNFRWEEHFTVAEGELDLSRGVELHCEFIDPQGTLTTANDDLIKCLKAGGIYRAGGIPLITRQITTSTPESFTLDVNAHDIQILSGDSEGIRRGIYYLEEQLLASPGAVLPIGITERNPWLKNRLSRCFFGPIKRPPFNHDELMDEVDYYPDEYLNRLAHEGVNGLWLTIVFRDLCKTSITELRPDAEKRLAKLRRTVDKCLRYGIKTWVFCIEPAGMLPDDPLLKQYPELKGAWCNDRYCFCPSSELAQQYLAESTNWLFSQVPGLGGILNISHGERVTTCLSSVSAIKNDLVECPRCGSLPHGEILRQSLTAMYQGMVAAVPDAQFISWLYMPQPAPLGDWVHDLPNYMPDGVVLQFNFESGGHKKQLGRPRCGGDYWLSFTGPSERFGRIAARIADNSTELSAKLQVGCSHEVASIPFVPVPGLLYRKYEQMKKLGVSHVTQCWYFGNYPGLMNRAAGMLAGENFNDSETAFLTRLAHSEWGTASATVVRAWQHFAEGYSYYPLSNQFQYYGPMHAGISWPLYLKPTMKSLVATWKPNFELSGDVIGECLENHTLDEAIILCRELSGNWNKGVELLKSLRADFAGNNDRLLDIGLAEALGLQFASGYNILKFYQLRKALYSEPGRIDLLDEMKAIVEAEIGRSEQMIIHCEQDSRLGFHSEAESYIYYPELLKSRIKQLRNLLATEFVEVVQQLAEGRELVIADMGKPTYNINDGWHTNRTFSWRALLRDEKFIFEFDFKDEPLATDDNIIVSLLDKYGTEYPLQISFEKNSTFNEDKQQASMLQIKQQAGSWQAELTLLQIPENCYLEIIRRTVKDGKNIFTDTWPEKQVVQSVHRLNLYLFRPENCGRLIVNQKKSPMINKQMKKTRKRDRQRSLSLRQGQLVAV
jgi:hypothetical protein